MTMRGRRKHTAFSLDEAAVDTRMRGRKHTAATENSNNKCLGGLYKSLLLLLFIPAVLFRLLMIEMTFTERVFTRPEHHGGGQDENTGRDTVPATKSHHHNRVKHNLDVSLGNVPRNMPSTINERINTTMMRKLFSVNNVKNGIFFLNVTSKILKVELNLEQHGLISSFAKTIAATNTPVGRDEPFSDFDWSAFPVQCGAFKCFWASASNASEGYLVSKGNVNFHAMNKAFEFEQFLIETYHIPQLSLEPPRAFWNVSNTMRDLLSSFGNASPENPDNLPVVVQKVIQIPQPHLLIHASKRDSMKLRYDIPKFATKLANNNTEAFRMRFLSELKTLKRILIQREDLIQDFQVIVSANGDFYHMDLDRGRTELDLGNDTSTPQEDSFTLLSNMAKYMESMERVLFWLTESKGNFQGLHDEIMLGYPWLEEWVPTATSLSKAGDESKQDNKRLLVEVLKNFLKRTSSFNGWKDAVIGTADAVGRQEGEPWTDIDWESGVRTYAELCSELFCFYPSMADPSRGYTIRRPPMNNLNYLKDYKTKLQLSDDKWLKLGKPVKVVLSFHLRNLLVASEYYTRQSKIRSFAFLQNATTMPLT